MGGSQNRKIAKEKEAQQKKIERELIAERVKIRDEMIQNKIMDERREKVDIAEIKKEIVLFYRFLEKFIKFLNEKYFSNASADMKENDDAYKDITHPKISNEVAADFEKLDNMTDLEVYNSTILQYAIHFNLQITPHSNALEQSPNDLFIGRNDSFILTPDSRFDLVQTYNTEENIEIRTRIRTYLTNMYKMSYRLNEQIDYDVITDVLMRNNTNIEDAKERQRDVLDFYNSVNKAKKALKNLTDDNTGTIDTIVDTAAHEFRDAQKEFKTTTPGDADDEEGYNDPSEFIEKNGDVLKKVTRKVTNSFGSKLASGEIDTNNFSKIANNMMAKLGKGNKKMKFGKLDINKIKEIGKKNNGDFAKDIEIDKIFKDVIGNVNSVDIQKMQKNKNI